MICRCLLLSLGPLLTLIPAEASGGDLNPPGPPGSTMVTLEEIASAQDPRIPITAVPVTIEEAGSYYLTGDMYLGSGAGTAHAISVRASGVTIDLNGYTLWASSLAEGGGIIQPLGDRARVFNGTVQSFAQDGISLGDDSQVHDVIVVSNDLAGVSVGENSIVFRVTADNNHEGGIVAGHGSAVTQCTATRNFRGGIITGTGCTITDNTCRYITSSGGLAGIGASSECLVSGNTCTDNPTGIEVGSRCLVTGNNICGNSGNGLLVPGSGCRIDSNHVADNGISGIRVLGTDNIVVRNTAFNNSTANYTISAGNFAAQQIAPSAGMANTDPWANFSF
ncbi:right-handed parallel beta-helix repeat-containing protein [Candidatus Sumerlaeota bacterium]|nr:right-handed parallel beta-helix repeat-containing protein [Candidatus Sumerlaeota bacterium]